MDFGGTIVGMASQKIIFDIGHPESHFRYCEGEKEKELIVNMLDIMKLVQKVEELEEKHNNLVTAILRNPYLNESKYIRSYDEEVMTKVQQNK